jgi:hypothetical protein
MSMKTLLSRLYTMPAALTLHVESKEQTDLRMTVFTMDGRIAAAVSLPLAAGTHTLPLPSHLS